MLKKALILLILINGNFACFAAHRYTEKYYQNEWCSKACGKTEYRLDDNTRVDCLTNEYAIEFDFAPKWAESVGQSLYYAEKTNLKPGVVLIMEKDTDYRYYKRLKVLADKYDIKLWCMDMPPKN